MSSKENEAQIFFFQEFSRKLLKTKNYVFIEINRNMMKNRGLDNLQLLTFHDRRILTVTY